MRRWSALLLLLAAAGCGGDGDPPPRAAGPVTATVMLDRAPAGSPDGGMEAGHRGGYEAVVEGPELAFEVVLRPADAELAVTGGEARVTRAGGGRATVRVAGLRGTTVLRLTARAPGRRAWAEEVTVTRTVREGQQLG